MMLGAVSTASFLLALSRAIVQPVLASVPLPAQFYTEQLVDHDDHDNTEKWSQRYYVWSKEFKGPGHAIFCILGGEGNIEPSTGIVYPFISHYLAKTFGAFVLQPEHRFYGKSQPISPNQNNNNKSKSGDDPRTILLTPKQALQDANRLIRYYQTKLGCSLDKSNATYCPVITVGGSYSGWLSAMARLVFPQVVDMAYSASAPMLFYSQGVGPHDYYNHITEVAKATRKHCARDIKLTLEAAYQEVFKADPQAMQLLAFLFGLCEGTLPSYIDTPQIFADEMFMVIGYTFANLNMANYPPNTENSTMYQACLHFENPDLHYPIVRVRDFLMLHLPTQNSTTMGECIDFSTQLPTGPRATISAGDWSGVGTGPSGESWDFETCTLLVEQIGYSPHSMFPTREWSLDWMTRHCQDRFGVTPKPYELVNEWKFDDLANSTNASHILFTNGLNDGWSVGGIQTNISETLLVLNFENGAHHSDLSHVGPTERDTEDIKEGFEIIQNLFASWLQDLFPHSRYATNNRHAKEKEEEGSTPMMETAIM